MSNVLTQPVKIGSFKVPAGLLLLSGAALLAVVALTQKQSSKSADGSTANAFLGLYDAALNDVNAPQSSVSAPPSYGINPQPIAQVGTPIVNVSKDNATTQPTVNQPATGEGLININTAVLKYPAAQQLVNNFVPMFGSEAGVKNAYAWYDVNKNTLIDNETKSRFYG